MFTYIWPKFKTQLWVLCYNSTIAKMLVYITFRLCSAPKCFCTQRFSSVLLQNAFVHNVSVFFCSEMLLYTTFPLECCSESERRAAWECSAKMQNERHAAWGRFFAHL